MADGNYLEFLISGNLNGGARCITVLNFVKIGQTVAEISWIFKMVAGCHLGFSNSVNFKGRWVAGSQVHHPAKFHRNWSRGCGDQDILISQDGGHLPFLDLFAAFLDHTQSIFDGLYWSAKFRRNPCSSFDNMKIWIFCAFASPSPPPKKKLWFWGIRLLKWRDISTEATKLISLHGKTSYDI